MRLVREFPVTVVCQTLSYPRSLYYYQSRGRDDQTLKEVIEEVAGRWPTYGYRRITAQLRREGWVVNLGHYPSALSFHLEKQTLQREVLYERTIRSRCQVRHEGCPFGNGWFAATVSRQGFSIVCSVEARFGAD